MSEQAVSIPNEALAVIDGAKGYLEAVLQRLGDTVELVISNAQEYESANDVTAELKRQMDAVEAKREAVAGPLYRTWKETNGTFSAVTAKFKNATEVYGRAIAAYNRKLRLEFEEAQRKAQAEAEERRRQEEEAAQKEREKANAYREQGKEKLAEKAEVRADFRQYRASTVVAVPPPPPPKLAGTSFTASYKAEVKDVDAAVAYCMARPELRQFVTIDCAGLARLQKAAKGNLRVDGVVFEEQSTVKHRR